MKRYFGTALSMIALVAIIGLCGLLMTSARTAQPAALPAGSSIYEIPVRDIKGKALRLEQYKGKVMLIVNVASRCGYTPQYNGLQQLYDRYQSRGLVVLGFPANNFGGQEPGTDAEIAQFCSMKYSVSFPMFAKLSADGQDIHPLYQFLTNRQTNPRFSGPITWNFNKFLIDRAGQPIARFDSSDRPDSEKVVQAVENALRQD
ncbi:MAG: glutathione peroxidase [Blastocatellia bacterium]|jgi:glutathione peroxidase